MYQTDADNEFFIIDSQYGDILLLSIFLALKDSHYGDHVTLVGIPDQLLISHPFYYLSSLYLAKSILLISFSVSHQKPLVGRY